MKVGDLVRYKHLDRDIGLIVEKSSEVVNPGAALVSIYKVVWMNPTGPAANWYSLQQWDWMRETGLEAINENR